MSRLDAGFELFGEHILWTDLVGNVLSLLVVWLAIRKTIWTWPVQLTGALLLLAASAHAHAPGNALKQVLFCGLAGYGWWRWSRGLRGGDDLPVRPATPRERVVLVGALAAGTGALALVFANVGWLQVTWSPLANAYIFVGSAVATFGQGRALVDFWIVWVLVDLVGVPLAIKSGLYVSGAVYGVLFVLVLIGFRRWLGEYRRRVARTGAQVEAVTA